jgi:membrane protein YdbS with pleckstrin-like domain
MLHNNLRSSPLEKVNHPMELHTGFIPAEELQEAHLPSLERMDANYRKVLLLTLTIYVLCSLVVGIALSIAFLSELTSVWWACLWIFWALLAAFAYFYGTRYAEMVRYGIRDNELFYRSGVWFQSMVIIPFRKIQHCELESGPLDRRFGLASLTIHTAGGDESDISIAGLSETQALRLKQFMTTRISHDEEE